MKNKKLSIGLLLALIVFAGGVYAKTSHIVWDPNSLIPSSIVPGESASFTMMLQNNGPDSLETEHLKVVVSGDAASMINVGRISFPKKMKKGESVPVTFEVAVPAAMPMSVVRGSVSLVRADDDDEKDGKENEAKKSKKVFLADTLPVEITVSSIPMPPDPGEAGKQSLLGIDSDGNGVRDDIDRYIVFTYPNSEKTRTALIQYAQEEQKVLADAYDEQKSIENIRLALRASHCLGYVNYVLNQSGDFDLLLDAEILNTKERSREAMRAEIHFGGQGIKASLAKDNKSSCNVDPDTLAN